MASASCFTSTFTSTEEEVGEVVVVESVLGRPKDDGKDADSGEEVDESAATLASCNARALDGGVSGEEVAAEPEWGGASLASPSSAVLEGGVGMVLTAPPTGPTAVKALACGDALMMGGATLVTPSDAAGGAGAGKRRLPLADSCEDSCEDS